MWDFCVQKETLEAFYVVSSGEVEVTYHDGENGELQLPRTSWEQTRARFSFESQARDDPPVTSFGDWVLTKGFTKSVTVVAASDVECWSITRQAFEEAVGPLSMILKEDAKYEFVAFYVCYQNQQFWLHYLSSSISCGLSGLE